MRPEPDHPELDAKQGERRGTGDRVHGDPRGGGRGADVGDAEVGDQRGQDDRNLMSPGSLRVAAISSASHATAPKFPCMITAVDVASTDGSGVEVHAAINIAITTAVPSIVEHEPMQTSLLV